jgi:hypothetical protein
MKPCNCGADPSGLDGHEPGCARLGRRRLATHDLTLTDRARAHLRAEWTDQDAWAVEAALLADALGDCGLARELLEASTPAALGRRRVAGELGRALHRAPTWGMGPAGIDVGSVATSPLAVCLALAGADLRPVLNGTLRPAEARLELARRYPDCPPIVRAMIRALLRGDVR